METILIIFFTFVFLIVFKKGIAEIANVVNNEIKDIANESHLKHNLKNIDVRNSLCRQGEIVTDVDINDLLSGMYELPTIKETEHTKYKRKSNVK